jgi:hypothetical protein
MWTVSDRFQQAPARSSTLASTVTLTTPGGASQVLPLASGSVTVDRSQQVRRTAALAVKGGRDLYVLLSTPGASVRVDHGYAWSGTDRELVPVITGPLSTASLAVGDGLVSFGVADRWQAFAAMEYLAPYTPATTATRVATITAAVTDAFPGITIRNSASDTGTVATAQAWTSRADMVAALATDGGMEAFFAPDGAFVLRDLPTIGGAPVWTIKAGVGGTLKALTKTRPLDRLYNTVVLTPATTDPAQTWTQVVAQITDTTNPRHPNRINVRPFRYAAPTILTETAAQTVAGQLLTKVQGTTETFSLSAMACAALESGDIVRVMTYDDRGQPETLVNHFLEQISLDLAAGDMTASTRSNVEVAA